MKTISVVDFTAIQNLLGRYQHLVDEGDSEGWASLFTEDGVFASAYIEPHRGREMLKKIPAAVEQMYSDRMRHHMGSLYIEYGSGTDEAFAKYYSLVTTWLENAEAKLFCLALYSSHLLRVNGEWKIKTASTEVL
jgi:hypothetical protein